MRGSSGAAEPVPDLGRAFAAYRTGRRGEAAAIGRAVLARNPRDAGAHYVCGLVAQDRGALEEARASLEAAAALAPEKPSLLIALGNLALRQRDDEAAERAFRAALRTAPHAAAAHANLGTALKRQGRLDAAVHAFREALALHRGSAWWGIDPAIGTAQLDPAQKITFQSASRAKIVHDSEQIEYLLAANRLPPTFHAVRDGFRDVLAGFGGEDAPSIPRALTAEERRRIGAVFNRVVYRPPENAVSPVLNPALDVPAIARRYTSSRPSIAVIDGLLTPPALAALRRFCLEATIWFDCKNHGGYLGAYLHEGFDHPVLLRLAEALRERLPAIFGAHRLAQMWAFKYGQTGGGTRKHADKAAVNVNFWISPDEACPDPEAAGLTVYDAAAPPDWGFEDYNFDPAALEAQVARAAKAPVRVPYRCNRAVVFDSSLIHESGSVRFREGYGNRRINVTLLFGDRAETRG